MVANCSLDRWLDWLVRSGEVNNMSVGVSMETSQTVAVGNQYTVRWSDYPNHQKYKIWDMLGKIGDEVLVVYGTSNGNVGKNGLSLSLSAYGRSTGKVLEVVYRSVHLVRVQFTGCV